jgi:uncharacterized OsmC-like protein
MLMKAKVQRLDGLTMTGTAQSNHWITLDTSKEFGGQAAATTPLEAILISTGSCLGMFIAGMFKKHKKDLSRLVIEVIGEKADERTPYLTKITLICNITSHDANQAFIAPILEKAPDRCPVLVTLRQGLEIVVQGNNAV